MMDNADFGDGSSQPVAETFGGFSKREEMVLRFMSARLIAGMAACKINNAEAYRKHCVDAAFADADMVIARFVDDHNASCDDCGETPSLTD